MQYRLLHKKIGNNPTTIFEFEINNSILDYTINKDNFYFLSDNKVFIMFDKAIRNYGAFEFNCATSIEFNSLDGSLLVSENGGRQILSFIGEDFAPSKIYNGFFEDFMQKNLCKLEKKLFSKIKVDQYNGIYNLVKEANCIFYKSNLYSTIKRCIGNGFATYAQCSAPRYCSLHLPESIDISGNKLFIADTGNQMIRCYSDGSLKTFLGNPTKKEIVPSQVVVTKGILYYLENNKVYATGIAQQSKSSNCIYSSCGEIIIKKCNADDNNIYVLEKI